MSIQKEFTPTRNFDPVEFHPRMEIHTLPTPKWLFPLSPTLVLVQIYGIFNFVLVHVLQMLDMNIVLAFPVAPLFTVVVSLHKMKKLSIIYVQTDPQYNSHIA